MSDAPQVVAPPLGSAHPEVLAIEDDDGFVELIEVARIGRGRRQRMVAVATGAPAPGREHAPAHPPEVDEAAETGVFVRVPSRLRLAIGPWTPAVRRRADAWS